MAFTQWLSTLPGSPTPTTAATRSGLTASTLIRHAEKGRSTSDNVIAIARAFGVSPVDALVDNGFLRPDEIDTTTVSARQALAEIGIDDALRIVVEKVNASGLFEEDFTLGDAANEDVQGTDAHGPNTVVEIEPERELYVANRRRPEPTEGDDEYGDGA